MPQSLHTGLFRLLMKVVNRITTSYKKLTPLSAHTTSSLTPIDLYLDAPLPIRLAVLGTCVAEHLVNASENSHITTSHYLTESWIDSPIQCINLDDYDASIIHTTLRHILDLAAREITNTESIGDVAYISDNPEYFEELTSKSIEILKQRISQILSALGGVKPIFFLSLLEPTITTKGLLFNNRQNTIYRLVRDLNDSMSSYLENNQAYYIEVNDIIRYYGDGSGSDNYKNHFTHAGIFATSESDMAYKSILKRIENALHILSGADQIKLIITDLDNTLWRGIAAEEDEIYPWLFIEGWPIGYLEALLECKRRGILLAICSKNNDEVTRFNFKKIWGNKVLLDDFCSIRINWNQKSQNIRDILHEVNLLPQNTLFIDDNPIEIAEVKRAFPEIRTLTYPPEHWRNVLFHSPQTQVSKITEESKNRTQLVKAKISREIMATKLSRVDFLKELSIESRFSIISTPSHADFNRAIELLNKTNQFNTTGKRWLETELASFFNNGGEVIACRVSDKHTSHGIVSVALLLDCQIIQIVLSCRVFSLGIESAVLSYVSDRIMNSGCTQIQGVLRKTGRNATCLDFFSLHGFQHTDTGEDTDKWIKTSTPQTPSWIKVSPL